MTDTTTRFAPSPNGFLHLGHALSALTGFRAARDAGGRFLLRIEDIDLTRARPEFEQAIYDDLAWLGLTWETPVRRQSEHLDDYAAALARLDGDVDAVQHGQVAEALDQAGGADDRGVRHVPRPIRASSR